MYFAGEWDKMPSLPCSMYLAAACVCNEKIFVIKNNIQYLTKGSQHWTQLQVALPYEQGLDHCAALGGSIYILASHADLLISFDINSETVTVKKTPATNCTQLSTWRSSHLSFVREIDNQDDFESSFEVLLYEPKTEISQVVGRVTGTDMSIHDILEIVQYPNFRKWNTLID